MMASNSTGMQSSYSYDQPARIQAELVMLLGQFVNMIASHATIELRDVPEFRTIIYQLCENAPEAAQTIAGAIRDNITHSGGRKRKLDQDPSYRPPKSARRRRGNLTANKFGKELNVDKSPSHSGKVHGENSVGLPSCTGHHLPSSKNSGGEGEKSMASAYTTIIAAKGDLMASSKVRNASSAPSESELPPQVRDGPIPLEESPAPQSAKSVSATPTRQTQADGDSSSLQTEEICREKIPASLESIKLSGQSTPRPLFSETDFVTDLTLQAARTIYQLSRHLDGVPRDVHVRILQSFQGDNPGAIAAAPGNQWSDGSIWMQVLEMGASQQTKVTVLNMLEYMGAWQWYDNQVRLAQATILTKKHKPVERRGAAIHVLDKMQEGPIQVEGSGKWIGGVGMVTLQGDKPNIPSNVPASITASERHLQRKHISMQLSRGQKLSTKLVKELGLGILFHHQIWKYTKMSMGQLDILVREIQADPRHMKLLKILSSQLERLIKDGSPDLHMFYRDLQEAELISESEIRELQMACALEGDYLPEGKLDAAIDCLIEGVNTKVLSKAMFEHDDTIAINMSAELPCEIFQRLRPGHWLDMWTIMGLMQLSDKPAFVRHDLSIPLDEIGSNNQIRPIKRPLRGWAMRIAKHRREAKEAFGNVVPLVYFCPINHNNNHFTLVEINERERAIRHYDSMAQADTIHGTKETRMSRLIKEEFSGLKFSYQEAPTPQQNDGWSCGIRAKE
ncbi:uncharacterized protein ATNIH1004_000989 [Aspergillus tanneri]|uniref:Ubiquitin-like protease family profile domain-containing protein n=1 Tax=Aspergillus tanneri TaxID=1220188 RepID=A0A5M9MYB3_9EURO|nr:uncharacterized protein ATNIH1004_000989 [Aspergillus tanneri]KAA8652085.1 hypothetical protein ATNIH1004_000989 [Aspergillus tanneri]